MRAFWTLLLLLHGALHLLGFFAWARLARVPELEAAVAATGEDGRAQVLAALWLLASALFLAAAWLRAFDHAHAAHVALVSVLLSQTLILLTWHEAKAGTLPNLLIAVNAAAHLARARFARRVRSEVEAMFARTLAVSSVEPALRRLSSLPAPVRAWLERCGATVQHASATSLRLTQQGALRMRPGGRALQARAQQYVTWDRPAFVWHVESELLSVLSIQGRDKYDVQGGEMWIKAGSLVNLVRVNDDAIAEAALLRFLAECMWFPQAALRPYIAWSAVDATSARATLRHAGREVTALFTFDSQARVTGVCAERPMGRGPRAKRTPWGGRCSAFGVIDGIEIPVQGEVYWTLPEGDFVYYEWQILDVEYGARTPYAGREPALKSSAGNTGSVARAASAAGPAASSAT